MIDGAPALAIDSQCACRFGGIITIVPPEPETAEAAATAGEGTTEPETTTEEAAMEPIPEGNVQAAAIVMLSEEAEGSGEQKGKSGSRYDAVDRRLRELEEYQYIWKYVQEDILGEINPEWTTNMDTFKQIYGKDVFGTIRGLMQDEGE